MFMIGLLVDCKDYVSFMTKNKQKLLLHKVKGQIALCLISKGEKSPKQKEFCALICCCCSFRMFITIARWRVYSIGSTSTLKIAKLKP